MPRPTAKISGLSISPAGLFSLPAFDPASRSVRVWPLFVWMTAGASLIAPESLEIPAVFEGPAPKRFRDGIASVRIDGSWGFIDRSGSFLIKPEYERVRHFSEGRACVRRNGKWGMIDADGQQILDCQFDELEPLNAGMAAAKIDGKAGFISAAAKWLIEPKFDKCLRFFGNLAVLKLERTYSYIRRDGQIVWTSQPEAQLEYPPPPFFV